MIYETIQKNHFNKPDTLFVNNHLFTSFSKVGFLIKDGHNCPNGANALSLSKQVSIKKAFSEILERRNLLLGGTPNEKGFVATWNIVTDTPSYLEYKYTSYRTEGEHPSDTTGTATHFDSRCAVNIAVVELLEKNALFLFWYGKEGHRLILNEEIKKNNVYMQLSKDLDDIKLFINTSFNCLKVVFTILYREDKIVVCGIGTSFDIHKAIQKSLEEAYVLKWQAEFNHVLNFEYLYNPIMEKDYETQLNYLDEFDHLPVYQTSYNEEKNVNLKKCLPEWMTNLHVILLQNDYYPQLKCVKVFSTDLYNHVPLHKYVRAETLINKMTLNLSEKEIINIPNCIFI